MAQVDPVLLQLRAEVTDYENKVNGASRLSVQRLDDIEKAGERMGVAIRGSLDKAGDAVTGFARRSGEAASGLGRVTSGLNLARSAAVAFASTAVVDKIVEATSAGLEYASSLGETAQQLGVTSDALQEYRYAATQVGLSSEEMDQALSQLTRRIGEAANGTKEQAKAFDKLKISVHDANGSIIATGDAIPRIAEGLKGIGTSAERSTILMDLFGRAGQKLEPLLSGGASGVNNLRDAAHNLGIVLSEDQIANADNAADKLSEVKLVLEANIAGVVSNNADAVVKFADALAQLAVMGARAVAILSQLSNTDWGSGLQFAFSTLTGAGPLAAAMQYATDPEKRAAHANPGSVTDAAGLAFEVTSAVGGYAAGLKNSPFTSNYTPKPKKGAKGSSGDGGAAADAHRQQRADDRVQDDLDRDQEDILRATADRTGAIDDKYAAMLTQLDNELASYKRRITTDENISATQANHLVAAKAAAIDAQRAAVLEKKRSDLADQQYRLESDANRLAQDDAEAARSLATTRRDQLAIEKRILLYKQSQERADYEHLLQSTNPDDVAQGKAGLANIDRRQAAERTALSRQYASPLAKFADDLNNADIGDQVETYAISEMQSLRDSLHAGVSKVIGTKDPLINGLIDLLIEQVVMKPLANALAGASSGGGGGGLFGTILSGVGSLLGAAGGGAGKLSSLTTSNVNKLVGSTISIGARASGGDVSAGEMYRVNEGASPGRVEAFIPRGSGQIIPLGQMNAVASRGGTQRSVVQLHVTEGQLFEPTVQRISGDVSVEVVRGAAPQIIDTAARETMARAGRPRM